MPANANPSFEALLQQAKAGEGAALGCLLESYNSYLKLLAGALLRTASRASLDVSDVVQETNLLACRGFARFRGCDEPELVAWLRRILVNRVSNLRKKRGILLQHPESLEALLERVSEEAHIALAAPGSTPSAQVARREQAVLTANAMESLEPDHRQVLILHYLQKIPHQEIGLIMGGRSAGASRMLLCRAAKELVNKLQDQP